MTYRIMFTYIAGDLLQSVVRVVGVNTPAEAIRPFCPVIAAHWPPLPIAAHQVVKVLFYNLRF